jgi:hypothetical protein
VLVSTTIIRYTRSIFITKILLVGSYAVENNKNVDVNAGKVGRYRQLVIEKDTIREKHLQESWRIGTYI